MTCEGPFESTEVEALFIGKKVSSEKRMKSDDIFFYFENPAKMNSDNVELHIFIKQVGHKFPQHLSHLLLSPASAPIWDNALWLSSSLQGVLEW